MWSWRRTLLLVLAGCSRLPGPPGVELAREVSAARLEQTVRKLVSFGTRHTASKGIVEARKWIKGEFDRIAAGAGGRMRVEEQSFLSKRSRRLAEGVEIVNVYAVLAGTDPEASKRMYVVSGHYDSRASDGMDAESDAPGANDDGSGVAVVLELARIFARHPAEATLVFLCVAGEEQGLFGSRYFALKAREQGLDIAGMFTNDIVGNSRGPGGKRYDDYVRVFSEGTPSTDTIGQARMRRTLGTESDSPSRQLARYVREAARGLRSMQVKLVLRHDRFLRGGDHIGFNEAGYAAVRFTEPYEDFAREHKDVSATEGDLPDFVDYPYLARVARVNLVALYGLAHAPAPPAEARIHALRLENTTTLSWKPSRAPDFSHYEVVWRDTTESDWTHHRRVEATEVTLPLSKDDWHFGVRSVDQAGHRSRVRYPRPKRRPR